jgi:hypothetical protein
LIRGELDHGPLAVGIAEGREDLPAHPEVGVAHVADLRGLGHLQRQTTESVGSHRVIQRNGSWYRDRDEVSMSAINEIRQLEERLRQAEEEHTRL